MNLEILKSKQELRDLIDAYAILGDEKKISEQMSIFERNANYRVYMNGTEVASIIGTDKLEEEFNGHASLVKTYFTMNGHHIVQIDGDTATGILFSQIKMVRENEGRDVLTDYSVRYDDEYIRSNGKWLIKKRIGHFLIIEARTLIQ